MTTYQRAEVLEVVDFLNDLDRYRLLKRLAFAHPSEVMDALAKMRADDLADTEWPEVPS